QIKGSSKGGYYSESAPMSPLSFQMFNRTLTALRWRNCFISLSDYLLPEKGPDEPVSGDDLLLSLSKLIGEDYSLTFLSATETEQNSLQKRILDLSMPEKTSFKLGYLSSGFVLHDIKQILLPLTEITQRYKIRRQKQRSTYHTAPSESYDL